MVISLSRLIGVRPYARRRASHKTISTTIPVTVRHGRVADETHGEVITVYTERSSVLNSLWLSLLRAATDSIDILVYAGLHLPEANPSWPDEIRKKCEESVKVRIAFGEPESPNVRARGDEEGVEPASRAD